MIRHVVLLSIKPETLESEIHAIFAELKALNSIVNGMISFSCGSIKIPGAEHITHGFVMDFIDANARDEYLRNDEHEKVKRKVNAVLSDSDLAKSVIAFDYPKPADTPSTPRGNQNDTHRHVLLFKDIKVLGLTEETLFADLQSKKNKTEAVSFSAGRYQSNEGLNQSYQYGCVVAFNDEKASDRFYSLMSVPPYEGKCLYLRYIDNKDLVFQVSLLDSPVKSIVTPPRLAIG